MSFQTGRLWGERISNLDIFLMLLCRALEFYRSTRQSNNLTGIAMQSNKSTETQNTNLGYLRLWQIIGDKKRNIEPLLPISRSAFYAGIKDGKYPAPIKLSKRTSAWRKADIYSVLNQGGAA